MARSDECGGTAVGAPDNHLTRYAQGGQYEGRGKVREKAVAKTVR